MADLIRGWIGIQIVMPD